VVIDNQSAVYDDLTFDNVAVIADALMEKFISGDYDKIELIYNQFKMPQLKLFKRSNFTIGSSKSDLTASVGDYILNRPKKRLS
jgi:F-type H+-transporting ATPase subunit gamma